MYEIRRPVVSDSFYPGDQQVLSEMVNSFLQNVEIEKSFPDILGVIAPHAGYIFSGRCAAYSYRAIAKKDFEIAVIIAPSHRIGGYKFSVGDYRFYETPLGKLEVASDFTRQLLKYPEFEFLPEAHRSEHSLEVQLPFLQIVKPQARILPIIFGNQDYENAERLAEILTEMFSGNLSKIVFIISSDLSHYHNSRLAEEMDLRLAGYLQENNIEELEQDLHSGLVEACGFGGIMALQFLGKMNKYQKVDILKYMHSGIVNKDYEQVVGYLSSVFYAD